MGKVKSLISSNDFVHFFSTANKRALRLKKFEIQTEKLPLIYFCSSVSSLLFNL